MKLYVWKMFDGKFTFWDNQGDVIEYAAENPKGNRAQFIGSIEVEEPECQHEFHGEECGAYHRDTGQCLKCIKCGQWIPQPKKTVTKEAEFVKSEAHSREIGNEGKYEFLGNDCTYWIPRGAKNIKPPTYEVEE